MWPIYLTVLISLALLQANCQHTTPTVNIQGLGVVKGSLGQSAWTNRTIYKFQAIPYAQPPIGELRFRPPAKVLPWVGTKDASKPGARCPQIRRVDGYFIGDEDCLTLSVYSNSLDSIRPVMVFFHGGWYIRGGANLFQPDFLLESDVVLVVVQYRLGPLGFLSAMSEEIPGNVGILDMVAALEWVQQYIGYFGGKNSDVTVFGQSAGSRAISAMLHSPIVNTSALFHRAILQSGSLFTAWAICETPIEGTTDIAARVGCEDFNNLGQCLREAPVADLLKAFAAHRNETIRKYGYPRVAGASMVVGGPSGLFPDHPKNLRRGFKGISIMGGVVTDDGLFVLDDIYQNHPELFKSVNSSFELLYLIRALNEKFGHTRIDGALEGYAVASNFLTKEVDQLKWDDIVLGLTDICGNAGVKGPLLADIQPFAQVNPGKVYLYSFDYSGPSVETKLSVPFPYRGSVQHTHELYYLFPLVQLNAEETRMAKTMVKLWSSFATTGIPTAKDVPYWPPVDKPYGPYLKINTKSEQVNYFLNEFSATAEKYRTVAAGHQMQISIVTALVLLVVGFFCQRRA